MRNRSTPVYQDPSEAPANITQTDYEVLRSELQELRISQVELRRELLESQRVQQAALRRITFLPQALKQLLEADILNNGEMTSDGQGMSYELGIGLRVTIFPYLESFVVSTVSGKMAPQEFYFDEQTEITETMVLQLLGYATLSSREDLLQNPGYFSESLSRLLRTGGRPSSAEFSEPDA